MRLYVWRDMWCEYTCGVAFALARSREEARELIIKGMGYGPEDSWLTKELEGEPEVYDEPYGFGVMGGG